MATQLHSQDEVANLAAYAFTSKDGSILRLPVKIILIITLAWGQQCPTCGSRKALLHKIISCLDTPKHDNTTHRRREPTDITERR